MCQGEASDFSFAFGRYKWQGRCQTRLWAKPARMKDFETNEQSRIAPTSRQFPFFAGCFEELGSGDPALRLALAVEEAPVAAPAFSSGANAKITRAASTSTTMAPCRMFSTFR
jgi:hypothetical protein